MVNLEAVMSKPHSSSPAAPTHRPLALLARNWDVLAVLLLMAATVPSTMLSPTTLHIVWRPGLFDDSWVLDTSFKASRGMWFGRDVAFNWGPLFQWLSSAPSRWIGVSMGVIYDTYNTVPLWLGFVLSYMALRLLLPEQPAWKRFVLLLLLSVFWSPYDLRAPAACFVFSAFIRGWSAVQQGRLRPAVFGLAAALVCILGFLLKADCGSYAVAALLLTLGGVALENWRKLRLKAYLTTLLTFLIAFLVFVIGVNWVLERPFDFRFWRASRGFVNGFRWSAAAKMQPADGLYLLSVFVAVTAVFLLRWFVSPAPQKVIAARKAFLLSALGFSFLTLQSGLVRADRNHIQFAAFPMLFLAGAALFSFRSRAGSVAVAVFSTLASALFATAAIRPSIVRYHYAQVRNPITTCPYGYRELDRTCYPAALAATINTISGYLQAHSTAQDYVAIFPYQYVFAVAARRNVADGVEQSFLAADPYLRQFNVEGSARAAAPIGLYLPDGQMEHPSSMDLSFPIDGVPNFTRNPEVWFWLFHHYRADGEVVPGVVALRRDDARESEIAMASLPLYLERRTFPVSQRSTTIDLGTPEWPVGGADFLRLTLKVAYSPLWKLRKPERLQLEITRADGSRNLSSFVLEPNVSTEVWFYPWNPGELGNYFAADESRWREGVRPAIVGLRLLITPLDWVSQTPQSVTLEAADAVRFSITR